MEKVSGKLDNISMSLERVCRKLIPEDPTPIKPKDLPFLPLKDEDAFYAFSKFLENDENFLSTVCSVILFLAVLSIFNLFYYY